MAGRYAGILGPLAMLTITIRGLIHQHPCENVARAAWIALIVFAAIGWVMGSIANRTVEEAVRAVIAERLAEDGPSPKVA